MIALTPRTTLFICLFILLYAVTRTWASEQVATLTQIQGKVTIFTHPSKTLPKTLAKTLPPKTTAESAPHALFEGDYYEVRDAHVGDTVENGNIIRTTPGSQARLIYPNGDQINLGTGTAYRLNWDQKNVQISLMHGKMRGVIEKGGPRTFLKIRTKSAVMGIRGTDFYIEERNSDGATEVSTLRGTVEVKPLEAKAKPVEVKSGYSADVVAKVETPKPASVSDSTITPFATAPPTASVVLRKTSQDELVGVMKASVIAPAKSTPPPSVEVQTKVHQLETQAARTSLKDIKTNDPELYRTLTSRKSVNADLLNRATVQNVYKTAPKDPPKRKPELHRLMNTLDDEAYEKYFKDIAE